MDQHNTKTCDCSDCIIYFNEQTIRPIKGQNITDEIFNKTISICCEEQVQEIMKAERYKSFVYQFVPYEKWKDLQNKQIYVNLFNKSCIRP